MIAIRKLWSVQTLLWLALVLALIGSLRHVAWGFSTLEQGDLYAGYIQAIAVDIGLFALAVGIQQRRRQERGTLGLWLGVLLFSGVSTYANLLHGLAFASDIALTGWDWLVSARPFVLSGVLPILVVYLSEVAASNVNHALLLAEEERHNANRDGRGPSSNSDYPYPIELARALAVEQVRRSKHEAIDGLLTYVSGHPSASLAQAGLAIGRSKTTVSTYLDELEQSGRIERNGTGIKVLSANGGEQPAI